MSRDVRLRLADILAACERISRYVNGVSADRLETDELLLDGLVRNLEVIGEAVKALPPGLLARAPEMDWKRIARMRDYIAHRYFAVDPAIVWSAATTFAPSLKAVVTRLLAELS